jgi:hypothetical protein
VLENIESFFTQALRNKVFEKMVFFLRTQRQDKRTDINAIKILKRVLLENADSSWSFRKGFLNELNTEVIKTGFFEYCMTLLLRNIKLNNIMSSSMLENIKILRDMKRFTVYHQEIQNNYAEVEALKRYIQKILEAKPQEESEDGDLFDLARADEIDQEREEAYLMDDFADCPMAPIENETSKEQLRSLMELRRQIEAERE